MRLWRPANQNADRPYQTAALRRAVEIPSAAVQYAGRDAGGHGRLALPHWSARDSHPSRSGFGPGDYDAAAAQTSSPLSSNLAGFRQWYRSSLQLYGVAGSSVLLIISNRAVFRDACGEANRAAHQNVGEHDIPSPKLPDGEGV
jgi:hypothetical protein